MIWLTDVLKTKHLRELREAEKEQHLDEGVVPLLSEINQLTEFVTTGCCAGHARPMQGVDHPFARIGYVSIRTTKAADVWLELSAIPKLLQQPFMDHVAKLYERDEQERLWCRVVFAFQRGCMEKFVYHFMLAADPAPSPK